MTGGETTADLAARALTSCLDHLSVSTVTEARRVTVVDAWTDGACAFCIVYRTPWHDGLVGLRRDAGDARVAIEKTLLRPDEATNVVWDHHNEMTAGYDMNDVGVLDGEQPDPVGFGRNVADFDIGEPHVPADRDPTDATGVRWHGHLLGGSPVRP